MHNRSTLTPVKQKMLNVSTCAVCGCTNTEYVLEVIL